MIARRLGPFPEIVESSRAGLLFGTPHEMRAAIERLASDAELAHRMGSNARASFEKTWSERAFLDRYFELIATTARRKGRAGVAERLQSSGERKEVRA